MSIQFVRDGDPALMDHVIFADDPDVPIIKKSNVAGKGMTMAFSSGPENQYGVSFTVPQQALRVRKIGAGRECSRF